MEEKDFKRKMSCHHSKSHIIWQFLFMSQQLFNVTNNGFHNNGHKRMQQQKINNILPWQVWSIFTQQGIGPWDLSVASSFQTMQVVVWPLFPSGSSNRMQNTCNSTEQGGIQCVACNVLLIHWESWRNRWNFQRAAPWNWDHQQVLFQTLEAATSLSQSHQNQGATTVRKQLVLGRCINQQATPCLPRWLALA